MNKQAFARLIQLLEDPEEEWVFDLYTATHMKTGIDVWIAIGGPHLWRPMKSPLTWFWWRKWRLWKAVGVAKSNRFLRAADDKRQREIDELDRLFEGED